MIKAQSSNSAGGAPAPTKADPTDKLRAMASSPLHGSSVTLRTPPLAWG